MEREIEEKKWKDIRLYYYVNWNELGVIEGMSMIASFVFLILEHKRLNTVGQTPSQTRGHREKD